jgi:hypothetical protein
MVRRLAALLCAVALCWLAPVPTLAQRFLPDDPLARDPDDLDMEKPSPIALAGGWDFIENTFGIGTPENDDPPAAVNVNTLGEVPDSTWFTNRMGQRLLTMEELVCGPNTRPGPAEGTWTVIKGKSEGVTPGFTIRDARDDVYFVKFDPYDYPNMASSADVIGTKFFHAFGYDVPENYVVHFDRERVVISPDATISGGGRKDAPLTEKDLDDIFSRLRLAEDGLYRAIASLRLTGQPIGPRKWFGTRPDDPNDVFPHEDRRDLRGLRVFSAWLNHDDSRALNSLDMYVERDGRRFVRHYLIDFASILGSGSIKPQSRRAGNEYLLEWGPFWKTALSLGLWDRAWRDVEYPDFPEIGRFEAEFFQPDLWRPEHPNVAFGRMRPTDAFWATRIVSRFTDAAVRAIVSTGEFDDPQAEAYLAETLIRRRDKIVDHWFRQLNPLAEFALEASGGGWQLVFEHLGARHGLGEITGFAWEWHAFDNAAERLEPLGIVDSSVEARVPVPSHDAAFLMVRLRTRSDEPGWDKAVDVYLRNTITPKLIGIEREE